MGWTRTALPGLGVKKLLSQMGVLKAIVLAEVDGHLEELYWRRTFYVSMDYRRSYLRGSLRGIQLIVGGCGYADVAAFLYAFYWSNHEQEGPGAGRLSNQVLVELQVLDE